MTTPSVVLAAGYTAGHINMALAVASELSVQLPQSRITLVSTQEPHTDEIVASASVKHQIVPGSAFQGTGWAAKLGACANLSRGVIAARRFLARDGVNLALGFGGYSSFSTLLAAKWLGVPTALHEANAVPGLANRLGARLAQRVYLGFDEAASRLTNSNCLVTGNPTNREFAALHLQKKQPPHTGNVTLLVTGGTFGSAFLNTHAPPLCARLVSLGIGLRVFHQTGTAADPIRHAYAALGVSAVVEEFFTDMPNLYRQVDVALSQSGAATLAELAMAGIPNVLVPLASATDDHQTDNAKATANTVGSVCVPSSLWRERAVCAHILSFVGEPKRWMEASRALKCLARPDAATQIVNDLRRWRSW